MSSGFVSAGGEDVKAREGLAEYDEDAWAKARQKIEEIKKPKPDTIGTQEGGKSLYEHLEAQKAAKQEAFEEASKLRNQFRPLDDSEVEFLESIRRKEEAQALSERKETEEQLEAFRKERAAAEEKAREQEALLEGNKVEAATPTEVWTTTKKRRRIDLDDKSATSKSSKKFVSEKAALSPTPTSDPARSAEKKAAEQSQMISITTAKTQPPQAEASATAKTTKNTATSLVTYDSESDD